MYLCTYFDQNYLDKGKVCHTSLSSLLSTFCLFVVCLDEKTYNEVTLWPNTKTIRLSDLETFWPDLLSAKKNRQLKEYYATLTPILPLYIFEKFSEVEILFYTDADIAFWSNPLEMIDVMGNYSIMVTDHGFEPPRSNVRFNVGILGYRKDDKCKSFLEWWRDRCIEWCYWITMPDGRMADQGYLNKLHEDYAMYNALNCPHPGINLGPWNIAKHVVEEIDSKKVVDKKFNLICYHYHEFRLIGTNSYYPTGWAHSQSDKTIIYEPYFKIIKKVK